MHAQRPVARVVMRRFTRSTLRAAVRQPCRVTSSEKFNQLTKKTCMFRTMQEGAVTLVTLINFFAPGTNPSLTHCAGSLDFVPSLMHVPAGDSSNYPYSFVPSFHHRLRSRNEVLPRSQREPASPRSWSRVQSPAQFPSTRSSWSTMKRTRRVQMTGLWSGMLPDGEPAANSPSRATEARGMPPHNYKFRAKLA